MSISGALDVDEERIADDGRDGDASFLLISDDSSFIEVVFVVDSQDC